MYQCCPMLGAKYELCLVLQCFQSLGYPKYCLCPFLDMKYSTIYRKIEFALVDLTSLNLLVIFLALFP